METLAYLSLGVGAWMVIAGLLHDLMVLRSPHGKKYDRNLLRLLMDGHILITGGAMQMIAFGGLVSAAPWGFYVAGAASFSIFVYCLMIFPFLKSFGTLLLNGLLLLLLALALL